MGKKLAKGVLMISIAINGFGRIGRNFLRVILQDKKASEQLKIVAINLGPCAPDAIAHLFKYDTIMGTYPGSVTLDGDRLLIDNHSIEIFSQSDPLCCPWNNLKIDWVVESSGCFTKRDGAEKHIQAGAKYVLITAPATGEDVSIIPGVNEEIFNPATQHIISLGSCTTNAIIPLIKLLHDAFGIQHGAMTTVHAYTNSQVLLDVEHKDLRLARAAALNMIPTTTGAMKMLGKIIPELEKHIQGVSVRVPVAKVSLVDFGFIAKHPISVADIHGACKEAMGGRMKGIVDLSMLPLVSSDYSGTHYSVVVDGLLTWTDGSMGKIFGWYDNEWGYSERIKDFLLFASRQKYS